VLDKPSRLATLKQLYAATADLCQQHGAAFVLVYIPFRAQYYNSVIQDVMQDLVATKGIETLDLMDTVKLANRKQPAYFAHDIHLNEYGNQVVAKAILDYLVSNGLVTPAIAQGGQ
jgi:lysophospholipase L1-like esterase